VHWFFDKFLEYQKAVIKLYYGAIGEYINCTTSGDDFGTQHGTFMSVKMFDAFIGPYMKERIRYTKTFTNAFFQHHTCGSVFDLIPSLIDCGVDILNPIQPHAHNMEPERLKTEFGGQIAFWGGIDTQDLLVNGSPEDVKKETERILSVFGTDSGGYILSPAHCIQDDVPPENVIAIYMRK
jgi:uroporphyrinogen decarboxylase